MCSHQVYSDKLDEIFKLKIIIEQLVLLMFSVIHLHSTVLNYKKQYDVEVNKVEIYGIGRKKYNEYRRPYSDIKK